MRLLMNDALTTFSIKGKVLDVGGGKEPSYFKYFKEQINPEILTIDLKEPDGSLTHIDLEKDPLPFKENSVDEVLMFNLLEHIYNYNFVISETNRVLVKEGRLLGFVPFLINYHPDPHDYFRYTNEALKRILKQNGYKEIIIKEVGRGPFAVNYNNLVLSFPKLIRVIIFPLYFMLDSVFLYFRPRVKERYALGYLFSARKI